MRILTVTFLALVLFAGCDRNTDPIGPNLDQVFGEFIITSPFEVSDTCADFANGDQIVFSCAFTTLEDWTIEITGMTTGSQRSITGFGTSINTENATWKGETDKLPIFGAEKCIVQLTFEGEPEVFYDTIEIKTVRENVGVLVADFESGLDPSWPFFYQSGVVFFGDDTRPAGQGTGFMNAAGKVPWDYLIGLQFFPASATTGGQYFPLTSNEDQLYFNVMVYGESDKSNSFMIFRFREDDNEDGGYTAAEEDMWVTENLYINWDGWQLVSIPYTDLFLPESGDGAGGNQVPNTDRIFSIEYLLLSDPLLGETRGDLDYIIFTEGGPLTP